MLMIKGELKLYSGSYSLGLILYSKKEGIGYLSPLGDEDEGSAIFLSTIGCLVVNGIDGLPVLIILGTATVVVEKFIFCIGSNLFRGFYQFYQFKDATCPSNIIIKK